MAIVTVNNNSLKKIASQYRITANKTGNADVTSSYEVVDTDGYGGIGTAPTESSGIFTFPSTGIYLILVQAYIFLSSDGDTSASLELKTTTDNSTIMPEAEKDSDESLPDQTKEKESDVAPETIFQG